MTQPIHIAVKYVAQDLDTPELWFLSDGFPPTDERKVKTLQGVDMFEYLQQNGVPILAVKSESYQHLGAEGRFSAFKTIVASHVGGCSLRTNEQTTFKAAIHAEGATLVNEKKNVHELSLDIFSDDEAKARKVLSRLERYILGSG